MDHGVVGVEEGVVGVEMLESREIVSSIIIQEVIIYFMPLKDILGVVVVADSHP